MGPVNAYLAYDIDAALEEVPPDCAWIRGQQEKFERLRGQKAVLVLGMCLLEDIVFDYDNLEKQDRATFTDTLFQAMEQHTGVKCVLVDARKVNGSSTSNLSSAKIN